MPEGVIERHEGISFDSSPADHEFDQRPEEEIDPSPFRIGTSVRHSTFGVGVVKKREGHGESEKVTVYFHNGQIKTLVVKFANLSLVG